jgi:hypothetical protein
LLPNRRHCSGKAANQRLGRLYGKVTE